MVRAILKKFLIIAGFVFALGLGVALLSRNSPAPDAPEPELPPTTEPESISRATRDYAEELEDAGWGRKAAEAVVALNEEWFEIQAEENPNGLERQLKLLAELGKYSALQSFIAEHPEIAGLLAAADDPLQIAAGLDSDEYPLVSGIYVKHASPHEASEVAAALEKNRDLIVALLRRGSIADEVLFLFERGSPSAEVYEAWLRETIEAKLAGSDVEFVSFVNLVMRHGRPIRQRLRDDESFRHRFRNELWPRLQRAAAAGEEETFELFLDEDRIWDLVALDNGEELLKRCGAQLPIALLFGYPEIDHSPYPARLHGKIIQILLRQEEVPIHALTEFRGEPLFFRLLDRNLSSDTFSAALTQLFNAGTNYPQKLALYSRLSDTALADEVGPPTSGIITWIPFYFTVWEVPKKLIQGREPTGSDLFSAAVDPLFLVIDVSSGGTTAAARKALLVGGKGAVTTGTRKLFVTSLGRELASKRVGRSVAEKMTEKELLNWSITGAMSETRQMARSSIGKATAFDITGPVQFMFRNSGWDRETVKRVTGLEARLFMRGDAKVYVHMSNLAGAVVGSRSAAFFKRTAQDLALGTGFESEPGQEIVHEGVKQVLSAKEQLRAWQQNVSAWWLLNASYDTLNTPSQNEHR